LLNIFYGIYIGSLVNVAKMPASTIQLCGAEKALFRALKKKHDTPKYGLIYHSSLVGRATAKVKGRVSINYLNQVINLHV
jgi:nucleolar protein 58